MIQSFPPIDPADEIVLGIDFTELLGPNEDIISATWEIETIQGPPDFALQVSSACDIQLAPIVRQAVTGGSPGKVYLHRCIAVTTDRTLVGAGTQKCSWGGAG